MKAKIICVFAAAVFALCFSACKGVYGGDENQFFMEPGRGLTGGGNSNIPRDAFDTAAREATRKRGLETDVPTHDDIWPPDELIEIRWPESQMTPGFLGNNGEGWVTETKWSQLEKDIVWEINKFRNDPVKWCKQNGLLELDGLSIETEFLSGGPRVGNYNFPAQPLYPSSGLHKAALHQTARGAVAHSDGSRVHVYADYSGWGENVGPYAVVDQASGGKTAAAKIVNEFIRDRGVADKGHRINLANPSWNRVGIACYKNIIVMQFGYGITDKNP